MFIVILIIIPKVMFSFIFAICYTSPCFQAKPSFLSSNIPEGELDPGHPSCRTPELDRTLRHMSLSALLGCISSRTGAFPASLKQQVKTFRLSLPWDDDKVCWPGRPGADASCGPKMCSFMTTGVSAWVEWRSNAVIQSSSDHRIGWTTLRQGGLCQNVTPFATSP